MPYYSLQNIEDCHGICQNSYCDPEVNTNDRVVKKTQDINGGTILYTSSCINHCTGRLSCAHGFVYDSPKNGPVGELDVVLRLQESNNSEPSWFLTSGQRVTGCRKGKKVLIVDDFYIFRGGKSLST